MKKCKKNLFDNKLEYLKLAYIISTYRLSGEKPPKKTYGTSQYCKSCGKLFQRRIEKSLKITGTITMPAISLIITIFVGIALYLVLSMIREQEQDKQKYD